MTFTFNNNDVKETSNNILVGLYVFITRFQVYFCNFFMNVTALIHLIVVKMMISAEKQATRVTWLLPQDFKSDFKVLTPSRNHNLGGLLGPFSYSILD